VADVAGVLLDHADVQPAQVDGSADPESLPPPSSPRPPRGQGAADDEKRELLRRFGDWYEPGRVHGGPPAPYDRVARTAVQIARVDLMSNRVGVAVRDTVIAAQSRATPALFPRSLYGMRDWWPPGQPYASDEVTYPERTP
jgi:hypothetical protein